LQKLGEWWNKYLKEPFEWLLSPEGGKAMKLWFYQILDAVKTLGSGLANVASVISGIKSALKTDRDKAMDMLEERSSKFFDMRGSFNKMIEREIKAGGKFKFGKVEMEATPQNVDKFMTQVSQQELAAYVKQLKNSGLDIDPGLAAQLVKNYRQALSEYITYGAYGPEASQYKSVRGQEAPQGQGPFAAPADIPRAPVMETKIPPTKVRTPEVEVTVQKQSPLKVKVEQNNARTESLLQEINSTLQRIHTAGRTTHASRLILQQQQG
jgi:hypothetical protein